MPFLNYRVFEATIVLKSYKDSMIDMFDAKTLLERLGTEAEDREMTQCGQDVCLKTISVKGSHCKLTYDHCFVPQNYR